MIHQPTKALALFIQALCLILISCDDSELSINEEEPIADSDEIIDYTQFFETPELDYNFEFLVAEFHRDTSTFPEIGLQIRTIEDVNCRYEILMSRFEVGNELIVRIDSLPLGGICLGFSTRVSGFLWLEKQYDFISLINGEKVERYPLSITADQIQLTPAESEFSSIIFPKVYRYPENTFASISWTNPGDEGVHSDFLQTITSSPTVTEFEFGEDGKSPYLIQSQSSRTIDIHYFKYESENDYQAVQKKLKQHVEQTLVDTPGADVVLKSWKNKVYESWNLD